MTFVASAPLFLLERCFLSVCVGCLLQLGEQRSVFTSLRLGVEL